MSRHRDWDIRCKVYVGNLGNDVTKNELETSFGKYGPLRNVWVARSPPGFAFIEYEDPRDAEDAVAQLDGTRIGGTRIKVEMSTGRTRSTGGGGGGGGGFGGGGRRGGYGGGGGGDRYYGGGGGGGGGGRGYGGGDRWGGGGGGGDGARRRRSRSRSPVARRRPISRSNSRSRSRSRGPRRSRSPLT